MAAAWRRVVASPEPQELVEMSTIRMLLDDGAVVICAGGGGIPVCRGDDGLLRGVEAVVDKDLTAALLAHDLDADALLLLTDVPHVETDFGTKSAQAIRRTSPRRCGHCPFPPDRWAQKSRPHADSWRRRANAAMIGRLEDAMELLEGSQGTIVEPDADGICPAR